MPAGGTGGVQVVIQQPGRGGVPGSRVIGSGQGPGVLADQVMDRYRPRAGSVIRCWSYSASRRRRAAATAVPSSAAAA